jgi:RimJ/RimL family protein N-acetyltransferase
LVESLVKNFEAVVLEGNYVRLEPLSMNHFDSLREVAMDDSLWRWTPTSIKNADDLRRYIETALEEERRGCSLPFVTIDKSTNKVVGSTRYGNIEVKNRRVEIGWTWINSHWQRTVINTEAKFLMLRHAFEVWNCIRVELKTDALNEKSRRAILRIGATEEGILRQHVITETGRFRDTVYFSILDTEWQQVKKNLQAKLASPQVK